MRWIILNGLTNVLLGHKMGQRTKNLKKTITNTKWQPNTCPAHGLFMAHRFTMNWDFISTWRWTLRYIILNDCSLYVWFQKKKERKQKNWNERHEFVMMKEISQLCDFYTTWLRHSSQVIYYDYHLEKPQK